MRNRRTMVFGILAALLIGSLVVIGCGSTPTPTPKPKYELPKTISYAEESIVVEVCAEGAGVAEAAPYSQTSGTHPVVYARGSSLGWKADSDYSNPWEPEELAQTELVACIKQEAETIEKCPYTLTSGETATVSRIQLQAVVTLREVQTGKVVASSQTIVGKPPAECKQSEQFTSGEASRSKIIQGPEPVSGVNDWLRQYVEIP